MWSFISKPLICPNGMHRDKFMFSFSLYTSLAYIVTTVVEMTSLHD